MALQWRWWAALCALSGCVQAFAGSVGVHKCTGADGKVSYQQQPCAAAQRADVVVVEGEIDPARKAEADAIAKANYREPVQVVPQASEEELAELRRRFSRLPSSNQPVQDAAEPPAKVKCPDTYDKYYSESREAPIIGYRTVSSNDWRRPPTRQPIYGTPLNQQYRSLPSKTYLKNAGRWPKDCVE